MLEGVLVLGEEARLIEKLGRLEVRKIALQLRLGPPGHGLQQRQGTSVPMTAAVCRSCFSSGGSRSMRAASTACTVAGICRLVRLRQPIGTRRADEHPRLYQGAHAFLQKERIAPWCVRSGVV